MTPDHYKAKIEAINRARRRQRGLSRWMDKQIKRIRK